MLRPTHTEVLFDASREVREFPNGWRHPKDADGRSIPLLPFGYALDDGKAGATMPPGLGATEIAAYETVSEGTPISPAFPNTPEGRLALINYCVERCTTFAGHRASGEAWAAILFGDAAVAMDGTVYD